MLPNSVSCISNVEGGSSTDCPHCNDRQISQLGFQGVIGKSRAMRDVFRLIERVADSDSTILINGETGTGKGLVAKAIHSILIAKTNPLSP